eukprot:gene8546-370_t
MNFFQVQLTGGDKTQNIYFEQEQINSYKLYELYSKKVNLPVEDFYFINQEGKIQKINSEMTLEKQNYLNVRFRILGGKGGFGANLKKQGRKKKVTNFNACRDLNGRRVRDIINEQNAAANADKEPEKTPAELKREKEKEEKALKDKIEKYKRMDEQETKLKEINEKTTNAVQNALKKQKVEKTKKMEQAKKKSVYMSHFDDDSEDEK